MRLLILSFGLTSVLFMDGCSTTYHWTKPGATTQQSYKDSYECEKESVSRSSVLAGGVYSNSEYVNQELWKSCLQARGYTVTEE